MRRRRFFGAEAGQSGQVVHTGLKHFFQTSEALPQQTGRFGADARQAVQLRTELGRALVPPQAGNDVAVGRVSDMLQKEKLPSSLARTFFNISL